MKTLARERDKTELLRRLRAVRPDSVPRWGRMSAHQMICHLSDAFRMGIGQKPVRRVGGVFHRTLLKWLVLYAPVRWPSGIVTVSEIDQMLGGTKPVDFGADIAQLQSLVEVVTAQPRTFEWDVHPIFGSMSERAWLRWGYLHVDHHLRQFGA
jgi:Protein of unknown function (DUF1569)